MRNKKDPGALTPSLAMAVIDAVPVLFFGASAVFVALIFKSVLFCIGAALCILAGLGKVAWKFIEALNGKDVRLLFIQMRWLMPAGFLLMIISLFVDHADFSAVWKNITGFPCWILFAAGCAGMAAMIIFAITADPGNARVNWTEQTVNAPRRPGSSGTPPAATRQPLKPQSACPERKPPRSAKRTSDCSSTDRAPILR